MNSVQQGEDVQTSVCLDGSGDRLFHLARSVDIGAARRDCQRRVRSRSGRPTRGGQLLHGQGCGDQPHAFLWPWSIGFRRTVRCAAPNNRTWSLATWLFARPHQIHGRTRRKTAAVPFQRGDLQHPSDPLRPGLRRRYGRPCRLGGPRPAACDPGWQDWRPNCWNGPCGPSSSAPQHPPSSTSGSD